MIGVMRDELDVLVVGAGPAGLSATLDMAERLGPRVRIGLVDSGRPHTRRRCPVDRQHSCRGCGGICNVIAGFGGSMHYGDGVKLSRFPSGRRLQETLGPDAVQLSSQALTVLAPALDPVFCEPVQLTGPFSVKNYAVASVGRTELMTMIDDLYDRVAEAPGVSLSLLTEVTGIRPLGSGFEVVLHGTGSVESRTVRADRVVVAVGRRGQRWWRHAVRTLGLGFALPVPSVGLRFECARHLLDAGASIHADFKTTLVRHGVKIKTFCFCAGLGGGKIKFTDYGDHTLLDGHVVPEGKGDAANFALLAQLRGPDGEPRDARWVEETLLRPYRRLRTDRPGKPVVQSYADFRRRALTVADFTGFVAAADFTPSVADYQMANLAVLLPASVHAAMCESFEELLGFFNPQLDLGDCAGVAERVAVIGLELESLWDELRVSSSMETSLPGLYAIGDCSGVAQGVLQSATSGLAAARHIEQELGRGAPV